MCELWAPIGYGAGGSAGEGPCPELTPAGQGQSPRRETDEMKPALRAGFLVGAGAEPPQGVESEAEGFG
jgi:hypothetical protein